MRHFTVDLKNTYPKAFGSSPSAALCAYIPQASPEIPITARPAVLVLPGGGYGMVSDREGEPLALKLAAEGYCAFVLRYAVAPHKYPVQALQAFAAIDYIRSNAEQLGVKRGCLAVMGFSAGGHLAGCTATLYAESEFADALGVAPQNLRPDAVVLCYPVLSAGAATHGATIQNVSGGDKALMQKLSLETRVTPDTPPCFMWHTADDAVVSVQNSLLFASALSDSKVPFELHVFERGAHGLSLSNDTVASAGTRAARPEVAQWFALMLGWLSGRGFELDVNLV